MDDSYQGTTFSELCWHGSGRDHVVQSIDPNETPEVVGYNFNNRHQDQKCRQWRRASTSDLFPLHNLRATSPEVFITVKYK